MKTLKRIIAVMMTVIMLVGTVSAGTTTLAAKKKVKKIKLNKTSITLYVGETYKLKATVSPSNASNKKVSWSSSNKKVATVSSSGKITAKKKGTVTITVKAKDGSGKKATCKVTVKNPTKVSKIKLNKTAVKLTVGKTYTLKATVSPAKATNKNVSWTSSKKSVATVNSKGKITAKGIGTATITCKAKDGSGKKVTCKVTVTAAKVSKVELNKTAVSLAPGKTYTLTATVSPSNATNKALTWKSSNTSVAKVSSSGKITAVATGTATVTATAKDGSGKKATCKVTVKPVLVAGISLSKTDYEGDIGETFTLTANVTPTSATNKKIIWTSSDESVATVSSSGKVTLVNSGEATIMAEAADDSGETASCQIIVRDVMVSGITLYNSEAPDTPITEYTGATGTMVTLIAEVSPSNATNKGVVWTSSNTAIADVVDGIVVMKNIEGTAIITATAVDGSGVVATCHVTADIPVVKEITISPATILGVPNTTDTLEATVLPTYATNKKVNWTSSDDSIVSVDEYGVITYKALGEATVTATSTDGTNVYGECKVTVVESIPVTSITLSAATITGNVGVAKTLTAKVSPDKASNKTLKWTSSDTSVATVEQNGYVRLVGGGKAVITVEATDGSGVKATCAVTSVAQAQSVGVFSTVSTWYKGKTGKVQAVVNPESASQDVTWSSSDTSFATVDQNGNVRILKADSHLGLGLTHKDKDITITATAKDGSGVKGTYTLTIEKKVDVDSVAFAKESYNTYVGQEIKASVTVEPGDASEKDVIYTSSNPGVVKVQDGELIAVGAGNATITATSVDDSSLTTTANVVVQKPTLYLSEENGDSLYYSVGDTIVLKAIWLPDDVIPDLGMKVVIEDESILKFVSSKDSEYNFKDLSFKLLKEGSTTVKITTADGSVSSVPVVINVRGVYVDDYHDGLNVGDTVSLNPEVRETEDVVYLASSMTYSVPDAYAEYFEVTQTDTGKYQVKVLKEFPKGAYITIIPDPSLKPEFTKNIYFSMDEYTAVSQSQALQAMRTYTQASTNATAKRDKFVYYNDINVLSADMELYSDNWLTNGMIQAGMSGTSSEELGADEMVYDVFGLPELYFGETIATGSYPNAITVTESEVESVQVIDDGGVTYQLVMTLGSQSRMGIDAVGTSAYAKAMPVINKNSVEEYKRKLSDSMNVSSGDFKLEEVNSGTVEQAYKDGKVILTVNKLTDKIESCDYYFKSDMKLTNANMEVAITLDSLGEIHMNTIATFTMTVEEKISFYDMAY